MSRGLWAAVAAAGLLLPLASPRGEDFRQTAANNIKAHTKEDGSPFRKALKLKLKERKQNGKKTPIVVEYADPKLEEIEHGVGWGPGGCEERKRCPTPGYVVKFSVTTGFKYGGPDEVHDDPPGGGKPRWPKVELRKHVQDPVTGEWTPAFEPDGSEAYDDYTQAYKDEVAARAAAEGKVAWKDDEHPDGLYEFGQEPQEEDVTEEITFTFREEDGGQGKAFFARLAEAMAQGDVGAEQAILMGFTYQGPNIDYTIGSSKRICIFGCFYLWDIRAGFALDFGLGLRAPALSRLYGPSQMVAGTTYDFSSVIETAPQGDRVPGDWAPADYSAAGVDPHAERGDPAGEGNEFVMYFEFFAGAKVKILGVNVCPWCQYVEIEKDYSASFGTPFGAGTRFPLPTVDVPVKDFDFGIVALTVGLYATPNVASTNISAVAGNGAEVAHSASGSPATFGVLACIENEAPAPRWQTVSLDEYRYNFDAFQIVLGAYLDFSVLGYGVWNPRFDFLTLDLSSALGSLGLYLPDHKTCNFAFQCVPAPVNQGVSVQAELLDHSPPSTALVLAGTAGENGWWTSDVTATMTPVDSPPGCGAGVASSWWGLSDPPQAPGTSFQLAEERIVTAHWRSADKDGNAEGVNRREVKIDKTPPAIDGAPTTQPNEHGWYDHDVVVHFVASDATSGLASLTPDTTLSLEAAGQEVVGTAEDEAGLTSTRTVGGIDIDKTAPAVTISAPAATGYRNTDTLQLAWAATDALSGVDGESATLDATAVTNGQLVQLVYLGGGHHELRASAADQAGNVGTAAVTFLVDVDIDGLLAAVDQVCADGWVKATACHGLRAKVLEAKASLALGYSTGARGQLGAFVNALEAQHGKAIDERAFTLLRADVLYVLVRYGLTRSA